jgi:hypothetical protein
MRYEIRPLGAWSDKETNPRRGAHIFKASWSSTLTLLSAELRLLEAADPVVFQIDVRDGDIRLDGMLRASARAGHPGVAVSFQSKYGPLRYATDAYERQYGLGMESWQANIRAIGLALVALRAVDRYGVTRRGEQYTGWKALPAGAGNVFASADAAEQWMRSYSQTSLFLDHAATTDLQLLYRRMARMMHPDAGCPRADWDRLDAARQLLTTAGLL